VGPHVRQLANDVWTTGTLGSLVSRASKEAGGRKALKIMGQGAEN